MSFSSSKARRQSRQLRFSASLALILAALFAAGEWASASPNAADVSFFTRKTVLWLGHTQIIPVHLKTAPDNDASYIASVLDPRTVEILRTPVFLAGEQTAYVRVHALRAGNTRLQIYGGPLLDLEVKPDPAEAANAVADPESRLPHIVSPMPGAAVWGEFAVGVTMFDNDPVVQSDGWLNAEAPAIPVRPLKVQLRLPDGRMLDPISETPPEKGPEREFQFSVPSGQLQPGPTRLVAVGNRDALGPLPGSTLESTPLSVQVISPQLGSLWSGECESPEVMGITKQLFAPARPAHMRTEVPPVRDDPNASGGKMVANPGDAWCLPFVVKAAGDYQMIIHARGSFGGGAYPSAALYLNDVEVPAGLIRLVGAKYDRVPIGIPMHLDAGPQILSVQFKNGFNQAKEDRGLYLDSYELARVGDSPPVVAKPDHPKAPAKNLEAAGGANRPVPLAAVPSLTPAAPPQLDILYPANCAEVSGVDAVVVQAGGGTTPAETADLLIDGQPQNTPLRVLSARQPLVFPLLLRGLAPGDHRLTVRATLAPGATADSADHLFTVLPQAPAVRGPYQRAVWLLDRLAFGPEPAELAVILTQGESRWLASQLAGSFVNNPAEQAVLEHACERYDRVDDDNQTIFRVLDQWINTGNPVRARFTAWTENHFSTWINKIKSVAKWREHEMFSDLGIAPFGDLLEASAHSPAMLTYLDQEKSYAGKINENYAREIMELHTLGVHGGYQQADVTALANVLNGWTLATEAALPETGAAVHLVSKEGGNDGGLLRDFRFVPALNDGKPRRVLGLDFPAADLAGRYDRVQLALEMLASHPSAAEHVCRKLAEHYVGVPAPDALVRHLQLTFMQSGGDMRAVLFAMVGDPAFWSAPQKVASPFDYGMRAARLCRAASLEAGLPEDQSITPETLESFLKHSGMGLFDRVTPDGYPDNSGAFADSNALLQRWRFMQTQVAPLSRLVPAAWHPVSAPPQANVTAEIDELDHVSAPATDPAQRFIDLAAVRLTGELLSPDSNQAALKVLGPASPDDMRQTLIFVSLLPETNLR